MKLGVDLGGTKIEAIVLENTGSVVWRERIATPQHDYDGTLNAIADLVTRAKVDNSLSASLPIGIGTPGALYFSPEHADALMKNSNSTVLNDRPFLADLRRQLNCQVYLENDANCFALAETLSGCGAELDEKPESVFGIILGTGVGGGIVVHQRLLSGRHHIAGEWGHNTLPTSVLSCLPDGEKTRPCYCGRHDCIETYLSGPGIAKSYALKFHTQKSSKDIIQAMRQKDERALLVWDNYLEQLAASIAQVVNILDPALIVLGGGMSLVSEIYQTLPTRMRPYVFTEDFSTQILPAKLGDSAGVYGAAWLSE